MRAGPASSLACCLVALAGCDPGVGVPLAPEIRLEWVAVYPIQCDGNPWERDWIERHPGEDYPGNHPYDDPEREIVEAYYASQGIRVFASRGEDWPIGIVCAACSCPEGWTLRLLVSADDVPLMLDLGFWREAPTL